MMSSTGEPSTMSTPPSTSTPAAASTDTICRRHKGHTCAGATCKESGGQKTQSCTASESALQRSARFARPHGQAVVTVPILNCRSGKTLLASTAVSLPSRTGWRLATCACLVCRRKDISRAARRSKDIDRAARHQARLRLACAVLSPIGTGLWGLRVARTPIRPPFSLGTLIRALI